MFYVFVQLRERVTILTKLSHANQAPTSNHADFLYIDLEHACSDIIQRAYNITGIGRESVTTLSGLVFLSGFYRDSDMLAHSIFSTKLPTIPTYGLRLFRENKKIRHLTVSNPSMQQLLNIQRSTTIVHMQQASQLVDQTHDQNHTA